MIKYSFDSW